MVCNGKWPWHTINHWIVYYEPSCTVNLNYSCQNDLTLILPWHFISEINQYHNPDEWINSICLPIYLSQSESLSSVLLSLSLPSPDCLNVFGLVYILLYVFTIWCAQLNCNFFENIPWHKNRNRQQPLTAQVEPSVTVKYLGLAFHQSHPNQSFAYLLDSWQISTIKRAWRICCESAPSVSGNDLILGVSFLLEKILQCIPPTRTSELDP